MSQDFGKIFGPELSSDRPEWQRRTGYQTAHEFWHRSFPHRANNSLWHVHFSPCHHEGVSCGIEYTGYKVYLHAPDEAPHYERHYQGIVVQENTSSYVAITPHVTTTSDNLRSFVYNPMRRQCFFDDERNLKFFKTYTQSNCELECLANKTLAACGCVKFSSPREYELISR